MNVIIFLLVGLVNGLFSTGAGQILVFYLVYILKKDTKEAREFSLSIIPVISVPTFIYYLLNSQVDLKICLIFIVISIVLGILGNKVMNKMNSNILNLISGIFIFCLSLFSMWRIK